MSDLGDHLASSRSLAWMRPALARRATRPSLSAPWPPPAACSSRRAWRAPCRPRSAPSADEHAFGDHALALAEQIRQHARIGHRERPQLVGDDEIDRGALAALDASRPRPARRAGSAGPPRSASRRPRSGYGRRRSSRAARTARAPRPPQDRETHADQNASPLLPRHSLSQWALTSRGLSFAPARAIAPTTFRRPQMRRAHR